MATSSRGRLTETMARLGSTLEPRACAIAGALAGLLAGWFGLCAGLLIGFMLDMARLEARTRKRVSDFFERPDDFAPGAAEFPSSPETPAGWAAATCLAFRGDWPGLADIESRRALWGRVSGPALPSTGRARREAERIADVAFRCPRPDLPGLARRLATSDAPRARRLLAQWAFAAAALGCYRLDAGMELELRAALGDCGADSEDILSARLAAFPGERDPWTVLGLAPGASRSEVKRAYRRLSRLLHPDASAGAGGGDGGENFRELGRAYAELCPPPKGRAP